MVRWDRKDKLRHVSPRRRSSPGPKTGPKSDNLVKGYREHINALEGSNVQQVFIPKVK